MLTPIQALLSAILTGFLVQLLTRHCHDIIENNSKVQIENKPFRKIAVNTPESLQLPKCPLEEPAPLPPVEVNKLLDALFVTHAVEEDQKNVKESPESYAKLRPVIILNELNFKSIYTGDWLILAHVPWFEPAADYLQHFNTKFPEALSHAPNSLNLATLNCHEYAFLSAVLQVRQYPALVLVTDSGRLRDWPFDLKLLDQEALSFLVNRHWIHLPVYQLLKPSDRKQPFLFTTLQIRAFNLLTAFLLTKQPILFNWIAKNRPLTSGILGLASVLFYKLVL